MFIKVWLQTFKLGSRLETLIEVNDEEWTELSPLERDEYVKQMFWEGVMHRLGDWGWEESRKGTNVRSYE